MDTVQELLDKVYDLPKEDFEAFDETYKQYRIEKRRAGFIESFQEAEQAKADGKLFKTDNVDELLKWLNG